ncbi:Spliceosome-associated protein CWC15, partial [Galemys pyrenaicus]
MRSYMRENKYNPPREHTTFSVSILALFAELEKMKKERAEGQARKEQDQKAEERIHTKIIFNPNPLLNLIGPTQPQAHFLSKEGRKMMFSR